MPKITVTLQHLLPESTGCGDFKTMLVGSVTAVPAVSGKQNIQHVSRFLRNMVWQLPGPISWSSPTQYFTAFFVANFSSTKPFGSCDWQKQSTSSSQSSYSVNLSVSWVVKSESYMS